MATQSVRDKMRGDQKKQLNVWLTKATATHLKLLSTRTGKAYPALITDALQALERSLSGEPAELEPSPPATGNWSEILTRLTALESCLAASGAQSLITPSPGPEAAEMAVSVAVAASAPGSELSVDDLQDQKPAGVVSTELTALIAAIPESEFTGLNADRNRKIIELHTQGLGTSQISKALVNANIANSKENSVRYFLEKQHITPNRVK